MVSRIGGQTCFHHGTPFENRWYQMQFEQIVEGKGKLHNQSQMQMMTHHIKC
jgi:hypothetical protein